MSVNGVPTPVETATNGLKDLETASACAKICCPEVTHHRYTFNGKKYVLAKTWTSKVSCGKGTDGL